MADLSIGFTAWAMENPKTGVAPRWDDIRNWALLTEQHGYDTFWIPDELVWEGEESGSVAGWWECVALTGAVAAVTSTIDIGSWVLSALHRSPGLTVKAVEKTSYGPYDAVVPEVEGSAFITGRHEFFIDDADPLAEGFILR